MTSGYGGLSQAMSTVILCYLKGLGDLSRGEIEMNMKENQI